MATLDEIINIQGITLRAEEHLNDMVRACEGYTLKPYPCWFCESKIRCFEVN